VLSGGPDWTLGTATAGMRGVTGRCLWLSDRPLPRAHLPLRDAAKLLGDELDGLVYDAWGGLDPDALGAAVGALRAGGLLLLLTPPLEDWPATYDPQAARIAVAPHAAEQVTGRFLARFANVLRDDPTVTLVEQGGVLPPPPASAHQVPMGFPLGPAGGDCRTPDQSEAVQAILRTARGRARRPLVISSERGRGKSSALGIAAARLLQAGYRRVLVTAPRRSALAPVFHHAARLLPGASVRASRILLGDGELAFLPPDALAHAPPQKAGLLLVDEAAGLPAPLLERLLLGYPRVVFATTTQGYEGTGQGFQVRFHRSLDALAPGHRAIELSTPVRWAAGDPVEALIGRALLLGASPAPGDELAAAEPAACRHEAVGRDGLIGDEGTLSELFGLLTLAHYQTRPLDLRHLLDGPNIEVHLLRHRRRVAAVALVALEGGLDPGLAERIFAGRRRPRGHLLPQTLSAHAGLAEAPLLRFLRVVRIAVHPAAQGRGLASSLLREVVEGAGSAGIDLAGASFGATPALLRFWGRCGFLPAHLGTHRNAASGAHAVVVLQPLSEAGRALARRAWQRFALRFPDLLAGPFRGLEPEIAAALLAGAEQAADAPAPEVDWAELRSFAFAQRTYEAALPAVHALLRRRLPAALRGGGLDRRAATVLVAKALQHRGWSDTARLVSASGRAEVIALLRRTVGSLIRPSDPGPHRDDPGPTCPE
jgi:tRNA(Met) cytidine acetyltransferase